MEETVTITAEDVGTLAPNPHAIHADKETVLEESIFCSGCQKHTTHKMSIDKNEEIVATCGCGHFLKFPANMVEDRASFVENLAKHEQHNRGQIKAHVVQAARRELEKKFKESHGK